MGCQAEIEITPDYCALINHPEQAKLILRIAERLYGAHSAIEREEPSMGAEDFSFYAKEVPGVFFFVGASGPEVADPLAAPSNHSPLFRLDEAALDLGTRAMLQLTLDYLEASR